MSNTQPVVMVVGGFSSHTKEFLEAKKKGLQDTGFKGRGPLKYFSFCKLKIQIEENLLSSLFENLPLDLFLFQIEMSHEVATQ